MPPEPVPFSSGVRFHHPSLTRPTLIKVVVDLGDREVPGLSYVVLSKVRHIMDLALFDFSFEHLQKIGASVTERKREEERVQVLAGNTLENWMAAHV